MEDDQTDPEMVLLVLMERAFRGPTHEDVRTLDWQPQLKRVLKCVRENDPMLLAMREEIERLHAEGQRWKAAMREAIRMQRILAAEYEAALAAKEE